jgi:hypothetical protein
VTEEQWQEIEKTLLPGADRAHFRKQLERIARDDLTPAQRLNKCDYQIGQCRKFRSVLSELDMAEDKAAIITQLIECQIQADEQRRKIYSQLISDGQSQISMRQYEILLLWASRGGSLPIYFKSSAVDFFTAASMVVFGKAPGPESIRDIIRRFRRMQRVVFSGDGTMSAAAEIISAPAP